MRILATAPSSVGSSRRPGYSSVLTTWNTKEILELEAACSGKIFALTGLSSPAGKNQRYERENLPHGR